MDDNETRAWIGLNNIDGFGPAHFRQLFDFCGGDIERVWNADASLLKRLTFSPKLIEQFLAARQKTGVKAQIEYLRTHRVNLLPISAADYPPRLKQIADPPFLLYVLGELKKEDELCLAVVGSRRMTSYGRQVTHSLAQELCSSGLTIVSGLALGVDAEAHRSALDANGRTIAVLGSGIDQIFPSTNQQLARRVVDEVKGAVISEFSPGTRPAQFTFPRRNRIISGLSLGVLVIEAAEKSGALITARQALEQGRDVFAVPGSIFSPMSEGTHNLIRQGAKLASRAGDILEELELEAGRQKLKARMVVGETEEEKKLLELLGADECHVDLIIQKSGLPSSTVMSTLTLMEMTGKVKNMGNQTYRVNQ